MKSYGEYKGEFSRGSNGELWGSNGEYEGEAWGGVMKS